MPLTVLVLGKWQHIVGNWAFNIGDASQSRSWPRLVKTRWNVDWIVSDIQILPSHVVLRLWCYRYISGSLLDHLIMLIWILNLVSRIITRISVWDLPYRLVHQLVTSPLPDRCINRSTTAIRPSTSQMCIIFRSVIVIGPQLTIVTPYRQETIFVVAEQTTVYSCFNGSFHERWGVINITPLSHLDICRVI